MSTTSRSIGHSQNIKKNTSICLLGLLIVINYATAIDYAAYRKDTISHGTSRQSARTSREILEQLNLRNSTSFPTLQDATEHFLHYGALLRTQILEIFGKLVYDHYDDFGMSQIEALYRIYRETLERKYNIFDIVPSILEDPDTRPTKICSHINEHISTCLKESSNICMKVKIHDESHEDNITNLALNVTRRIYHLGQIDRNYPNGFSLKAVLYHLRAGRLRFTSSLFSGLLHNIQYDNFDDKVRTAERELVTYLGNSFGKSISIKLENEKIHGRTISQLLKNYLENGEKLFPRKIGNYAAYLSRHVVREVNAVSENIELLGTVYDNSTINLQYLFELILPNDTVDNDIIEARDYLLDRIVKEQIIENYLRVEKYQQTGPDQLLMEILGQLRDINFAKDLVTSLYAHARFWHKSHMIENLNELLELFDTYENLRFIDEFIELVKNIDKIKNNLRDSKNVTIELLCTRPRDCLRIGLEIVANCAIVNDETKRAIQLFIDRTNSGCSCLMKDSSFIDEKDKNEKSQNHENIESTEKFSRLDDKNVDKFIGLQNNENSNENIVTLIDSITESFDEITSSVTDSPDNSSNYEDDYYKKNEMIEMENSEENVTLIDQEGIENFVSLSSQEITEINTIVPDEIFEENEAISNKEELTINTCNGTNCTENVRCTGNNCKCEGDDCKGPTSSENCSGRRCLEKIENFENIEKSERLESKESPKITAQNCQGVNCEINASKDNCTGENCLKNSHESMSDCEGSDCNENSSKIACESDDCTENSCEDGNCSEKSEFSEECEDCSENSITMNPCEGSDCSENLKIGTNLIDTSDCQGFDCPVKNCTGQECDEKEMKICQGPECPDSLIVKNCEGDDCQEVGKENCEGSDCPIEEGIKCKGDDCPAESAKLDCDGKDCSKNICQGSDCQNNSNVDCQGPDCPKINCTGINCPINGIFHECGSSNCSESFSMNSTSLMGCEGPACPIEKSEKSCEGSDCSGSKSKEEENCEGPACPIEKSEKSCEGSDCSGSKSKEDENCEGSNCSDSSGIQSDCVGEECRESNKEEIEEDCEGSGCSSDENGIEEECKDEDCSKVNVNVNEICKGPNCSINEEEIKKEEKDCNGSVCSIDAEQIKKDCEGENCTQGAIEKECKGPNCPIDGEKIDGEKIKEDCKGSDCPKGEIKKDCEGPDCPIDGDKIKDDCKGENCAKGKVEGNCEGPDCPIDEEEIKEGCEGEDCTKEKVEENCEGSDCSSTEEEIKEDCEGENCQKEEAAEKENDCKGPDCSIDGKKLKEECEGDDCPIKVVKGEAEDEEEEEGEKDCKGSDCPKGQVEKDCKGPDCPINEEKMKEECEGDDCPIKEEEEAEDKVCKGSDCPKGRVEKDCKGLDCPINEEKIKVECEGDDCPIKEEEEEAEDKVCKGSDCPKGQVEKDCIGPDCPINEEKMKKDCENDDCRKDELKNDCKGLDCPIVEKEMKEDCEGERCQRKNGERDCEGLDCLQEPSKEIVTPCKGENCTINSSPTAEEIEEIKESTTFSPSKKMVNQTSRAFCDNSDPHYRRKLHRLRKMRLIDALSSTPRSSYEIFNSFFESAAKKQAKIPDKVQLKTKNIENESVKMNNREKVNGKINNRDKNSVLQVLGNIGTSSRRAASTIEQIERKIEKNEAPNSYEMENLSKNTINRTKLIKNKNNVWNDLSIEKLGNSPSEEAAILSTKTEKKEFKEFGGRNGEKVMKKMIIYDKNDDNIESHEDSSLGEIIFHQGNVKAETKKNLSSEIYETKERNSTGSGGKMRKLVIQGPSRKSKKYRYRKLTNSQSGRSNGKSDMKKMIIYNKTDEDLNDEDSSIGEIIADGKSVKTASKKNRMSKIHETKQQRITGSNNKMRKSIFRGPLRRTKNQHPRLINSQTDRSNSESEMMKPRISNDDDKDVNVAKEKIPNTSEYLRESLRKLRSKILSKFEQNNRREPIIKRQDIGAGKYRVTRPMYEIREDKNKISDLELVPIIYGTKERETTGSGSKMKNWIVRASPRKRKKYQHSELSSF